MTVIALPPEWRKMDASDADGVDYIACGPVTSQGYAPTLLITRVRDTEPASIEKGMERILGNAHVDPTCRVLDVGDATVGGNPALVAALTMSAEGRNVTELMYCVGTKEGREAYILVFMAVSSDFAGQIRAVADIVAGFEPEEV